MNAGEQTITIPANGNWTVRVSNQRTFFCIATDGTYSVRADNGDENIIRQAADSWENAKPYGKLTFRNSTGAPITTTFFAGEQRYSAQNVSVTVPSGVSITNTPTVVQSRTAAAPGQFSDTNTIAGGRKQLRNVATPFRWAIIGGMAEDGTANAQSVFVGASNAAGKQPIEIPPGGWFALPLPSDRTWDFQDFYWIVKQDNDDITVIYV